MWSISILISSNNINWTRLIVDPMWLNITQTHICFNPSVGLFYTDILVKSKTVAMTQDLSTLLLGWVNQILHKCYIDPCGSIFNSELGCVHDMTVL